MQPAHANILIVDDNATDRDILTRRLRREGYNTAEAANAFEAKNLIKIETYDLILLDINMPGMSGFEFLKVLRQNRRLRDLPVFLMSASHERADVIRASSLSATDYITKPFNLPVLKTRIWRLLAYKPAAAAAEPTRAHPHAKVLVVERDPANRTVLTLRTQQCGHDVIAVGDAPAAMGQLVRCNFDLILLGTDAVAADADGLTLLRTLKADHHYRDIPVVIIADGDATAHIQHFMTHGAEDYIPKPIDLTVLQTRVRTAIDAKWGRDSEKGYLRHTALLDPHQNP